MRLHWKTKERIADTAEIVQRLLMFVLVIFSTVYLTNMIINTEHDTRIICLQVTHHSKECR